MRPMCGRYITPDEAAYEREWSLTPGKATILQNFNFAPTMTTGIIYAGGLERFTWGFQPEGSKIAPINARSETVFEKWPFKVARKQRCIVPAVGWYEWTGTKGNKQPHCYTRLDGRSFGFAGIWATRQGEMGTNYNYAILTMSASEWASEYHHRMPVILHPRHYDAWLNEGTATGDVLDIIDQPFDDGRFEVYPVSKAVNAVRNKGPELMERITL